MSRTARLGLFIFCAIAILGGAIFMVGDQQFLFNSTYRLKADFDTVSGLAEGAEVRVGGVHKGTVASIHMPQRSGDKIIVAIDLAKSTLDIIKKDSVASIETEGLLGNKFVEVSFGTEGAPSVSDGDVLQGAPPMDLSDIIEKTNTILDNVEAATGNLQNITSKVDSGAGTVGALVNDKTMYNQMKETTANLRMTSEQAKIGATNFQENMEALKHNWFFRGFFKNRGYTDSADLTKYEITKLPKIPASKEFVVPNEIFDSPDGSKLEREKPLIPIGEFLQGNPFGMVVVANYGGAKGDSGKALTRSQARALAVRQYLVDKYKLDDKRIKTKGMGKQAQGGYGPTDCIEILVYPAKT
jgi:phospholipid/cholesterol/gamma-HCH transport system substrate-binding protein